jgi:hypothetical protein
MSDKKRPLTVLELLEELRRDPSQAEVGICEFVLTAITKLRYIKRITDEECISERAKFHRVMELACVEWEYYSGSVLYPVEGVNGEHAADAYYKTPLGTYYQGEYGSRRLNLVDRMIDILKTELTTSA